jgi:hypothetical protein
VIRRAWLDGLRRVGSAPAVGGGLFLLTLLAAAPLAALMGLAIHADLGVSLAADEAADAVNYDWWQEFASRAGAGSLGSTFSPSILGFATTLDTISSLMDERPLVPAVALALATYGLMWLFVQGGILDRLARGRRLGAYGFFAASGTFFFRFLRLAVAAALVYWFLFTYVHDWLFARWYTNVTRDLAVERTVFYWRVLMYAIFAALLAIATLIFDYAKVRAVVEDRRSMLSALAAAVRFIVRHPGRVAGIYAFNALLFLAVIAVWAAIAPGAGGSGPTMWAGIAVSQGYILVRLIVKLQVLASETALFQRSLAHWGYTARPVAAPPPPPIVEST